jgi:hypothetical protein
MKFVFSTVYRVTQKDFYARPYTSMWAPVVAGQIFKLLPRVYQHVAKAGVSFRYRLYSQTGRNLHRLLKRVVFIPS